MGRMVEERRFSAVWTPDGGCLWLDLTTLEWVRLVVENHVPVLQPHSDQSGIAESLSPSLSCASTSAAMAFGVPAFRQPHISIDG
eukprot:16444985-Heterocapsa_arctica.AAC.1